MKIILAEDDVDDQFLFKQIVERLRPDVSLTIVDDGDQLIKEVDDLADDDLPSLVVVDENMARMKGMEAILILRRQSRMKNIPMVIYTTTQDALFAGRCKGLAIDLYIKSHSYEDLQKMVESIITKYCPESISK